MSLISNEVNRRRLLTMLGVAGAGATATALAPAVPFDRGGLAVARTGHDGHTTTSSNAAQEMTADEMDAHHEAGIKLFPAETKGKGGQPLEFTMDGDVKVFDLTCDVVQWEHSPGLTVEAWAYNGVVPGPEIRVTEDDKVRINVTNNMHQSTAVHFHGLMVPNTMDGVPFITQPPIKPGASFTYEFQVRGAMPAPTCTTHTTTPPIRSRRDCWARSSSSPRTRPPGRRMTTTTR